MRNRLNCCAVAVALALPTVAFGQNTYTWSTTTASTAWLNSNNWTGGPASTFAGADNNPTTIADGNVADIAQFGSLNLGGAATSVNLGVNFNNTGSNTGVGNNGNANGRFTLGAIDVLITMNKNLTIGKNDTSALAIGANLQLGGRTLGGIDNVILRNSDDNKLTLAPLAGGSNNQMSLQLTNTVTSTVVVAGTADIEVSAVVSEATSGLSLTVNNTGTGRFILSGANTYTGATTVTTGALLVNGNQAAATGAVAVASGGSLGGIGTLGGATTVQSGGTIEAGNAGIGTLNVNNNLTIQSGGTVRVQIGGGTGTGASDRLNLSGGGGPNTLSLVTGSNLTLINSGFDATSQTTYTLANLGANGILLFDGAPIPQDTDLFTFSSSGNYGGLNVDLVGFTGGEQFTLRRTTDSVVLVFSPVPEPALLLAVCGLAVGGVVAVRKLRRKGVTQTAA